MKLALRLSKYSIYESIHMEKTPYYACILIFLGTFDAHNIYSCPGCYLIHTSFLYMYVGGYSLGGSTLLGEFVNYVCGKYYFTISMDHFNNFDIETQCKRKKRIISWHRKNKWI